MKTRHLVAFVACGSSVLTAQQTMPVAEQNAMVQKYCAVCHTDASLNGGLSLEHFNAADADAGEVAMLVSKLKGKALGASGQPLPNRATQDAFQRALESESTGSERWIVRQSGHLLTAGIVRESPPAKEGDDPDMYRLKLTCHEDTHNGEMQLAWSPGVPQQGREVSIAADGGPTAIVRIEGLEKNGNGMAGTSGPGAMRLNLPLPMKSIAVANLFGSETVVFPFDELPPNARQSLSACFSQPKRRN